MLATNIAEPVFTERNGWIYDKDNNRASLAKWGSREAAEASLKTLKDCSGCSDCLGCSYCLGCLDCSDCSYCSYCLDCSDCSDCSYCLDCSDCSDCSYKVETKKGKDAFAVPVVESLHQKVYAAASAPGALDMGDWHTCKETHCRAGWIVTLAGAEGKTLEEQTSTAFAAMQIAKASGMPISPARFYDSNDKALADMKATAEAEAAQVQS